MHLEFVYLDCCAIACLRFSRWLGDGLGKSATEFGVAFGTGSLCKVKKKLRQLEKHGKLTFRALRSQVTGKLRKVKVKLRTIYES